MFYYTIVPRNKFIPLDRMLIYIFYLGSPGNICTKDEITAEEIRRRRRRTSSAVLKVLNTDVSWTSKIEDID